MKNTQAFPRVTTESRDGKEVIHGQEGMTLLDYFAAKAMQAIISNPSVDMVDAIKNGIHDACYLHAKEMLKTRKKFIK